MARRRRSRIFKKKYTVNLENNWVLHVESQDELDKIWSIVDHDGFCVGIWCPDCPMWLGARACSHFSEDMDGYAFGASGSLAFVEAMSVRGFRK